MFEILKNIDVHKIYYHTSETGVGTFWGHWSKSNDISAISVLDNGF